MAHLFVNSTNTNKLNLAFVPLCHRLIHDRKKKQCPQHFSYSGTIAVFWRKTLPGPRSIINNQQIIIHDPLSVTILSHSVTILLHSTICFVIQRCPITAVSFLMGLPLSLQPHVLTEHINFLNFQESPDVS